MSCSALPEFLALIKGLPKVGGLHELLSFTRLACLHRGPAEGGVPLCAALVYLAFLSPWSAC